MRYRHGDRIGGAWQGPLPARYQVRAYADSFGRFLEVRSSKNMKRVCVELGRWLQDESGDPVTDAVLVDDTWERKHPILDEEPSDLLVEAIATFMKAIDDGHGDFDRGDEIEE